MKYWCWLIRIDEARVPCTQYNRLLGLALLVECVRSWIALHTVNEVLVLALLTLCIKSALHAVQ